MTATERFLKYIMIDTTSDEASESCPSSPNQLVLGKQLVEEMLAMGVADARSTRTATYTAASRRTARACPPSA